MTKPDIVICPDAAELNRRAAERFVALANEGSVNSGRFTVALSGGSTPKALYSLLATSGFADRIPWEKVHLFWGDERCVPPDHPDSNFRMVRESLLTKISIPSENVHRMAGEKEPKIAAAEYEAELMKVFGLAEGELPRFDLILLGIGEDGHTASLFPGSAVLNEARRLAAEVFVERLNAHRITLTLPVLNASTQIFFLVTGENKASIIRRLFTAGSGGADFPAARVRPVDGVVSWFISGDTAGGLAAQP